MFKRPLFTTIVVALGVLVPGPGLAQTVDGGAPDVLLPFPTAFGLVTANRFAPSTIPDRLLFGGDTITLEGTDLSIPTVYFEFPDQDFLAGTGLSPLPVVLPGDVLSFVATDGIRDASNVLLYELDPIPEPASAALVALGLGALSARSRRAREER